MPRRRPIPAGMPPAVEHLSINENTVYRRGALASLLGLRMSSLAREIKAGRLGVHMRCGKYFFLGDDVLAWLRAGRLPERKAVTE